MHNTCTYVLQYNKKEGCPGGKYIEKEVPDRKYYIPNKLTSDVRKSGGPENDYTYIECTALEHEEWRIKNLNEISI